jgi:hypothetical protein
MIVGFLNEDRNVHDTIKALATCRRCLLDKIDGIDIIDTIDCGQG